MTDQMNVVLTKIFHALSQEHPDMQWSSLHYFVRWSTPRYKFGMNLVKIDESKPHGPKNSVWVAPEKRETLGKQAQLRQAADNWERCVGPIRKKYEQEIRAILFQQEIDSARMTFQYEHPDLVREGVVFHAEC